MPTPGPRDQDTHAHQSSAPHQISDKSDWSDGRSAERRIVSRWVADGQVYEEGEYKGENGGLMDGRLTTDAYLNPPNLNPQTTTQTPFDSQPGCPQARAPVE